MTLEWAGKAMTVTGPKDPSELGFTHSHEHIMWDYFEMIRSYDVIFDDEAVATHEVQLFKDAGGGTLVDCTSVGIGPRPEALRRISTATGVHIVLGCGWYRKPVYVDDVYTKTSRELADILITQIVDGFGDSGVRAGFIGEIGTERHHIRASEERVFRAAARASIETGAPIWTHTTHFGELALEQIDLLAETGIDPDRIVVSHLGDRDDVTHVLEIAKRGVYMSVDNIGYLGDGYPSDEVRLRNVLALLEAGYGDRVVLGTDIGTRSALATYGGRGYSWLIERFVPMMRDAGVSDADITRLTESNCAAALAFR
jgi:phosphotriesterase-related protein